MHTVGWQSSTVCRSLWAIVLVSVALQVVESMKSGQQQIMMRLQVPTKDHEDSASGRRGSSTPEGNIQAPYDHDPDMRQVQEMMPGVISINERIYKQITEEQLEQMALEKHTEEMAAKEMRRASRDEAERRKREEEKALAEQRAKAADKEAQAQKKRLTDAASAELEAKRQLMFDDRKELMAFLDSAEWLQPYYAKLRRAYEGNMTRGILISSGGTTLINHAYTTVKVLRDTLGCKLPIEIVHNGLYEMDSDTRQRFETEFEDVRCIDGSLAPYPPHHRFVDLSNSPKAKRLEADHEGNKDLTGFQFKIFSLAFVTSFDEVLMLDSDNLPLVDPTYLFESKEYIESGSLFFPDWWDISGWVKEEAYTDFGLAVPWANASFLCAESGQLLLNRVRHADVLQWAWFLNSWAQVVYHLMYGDKDTFRLAFHLAAKPADYRQVSIPPRSPLDASTNNAEPVTYLHVGMLQHDPAGRPAFLHRTAEGKFYLFQQGFRKADYVTVPLSSKRARGVLGHSAKLMGYPSKQIDLTTYAECPVKDLQQFHGKCGVSLRSGSFPIPVVPVADVPGMERVLNASYAIFNDLQQAFQSKVFLGR